MPSIWSGPLSVERITVAIADLSPSLQGTKIVHLSDLHYDDGLSETLLAETIEISNQENPDLILLTGDYVTDDPTPINSLVLRLKHLESKLGIFACLGNHDLYFLHSKALVTQALTRVGIQVLWNEIAYPLGEHLPIVGLADFWSRQFRPEPVFSKLDPNTPRIVLSHNPDTAEILQKWRVDLQLSGHSHGGQVVIPGFGSAAQLIQPMRKITPQPLQLFIPYLRQCSRVMRHWEWAQGFHRIGNNQLYVNRGLGTYFPGRFFCPPEVTIITLITQH
ncbi:metallophosphoesterase [Oscillatoria salina]|uniref:metallophosphoesterase n=1 Tax=Oscillatoria salina TaxID=331517 RepID=UPI0013BE5317|nr:metallophosphoesterase [Oscillatoria salina]MBZ8181607.1 metallophosphoesterase [Oscillatoria salina IIICB1]NET89843.1 metallophosphoesterase [Kamptonema sp. SIO1D9]